MKRFLLILISSLSVASLYAVLTSSDKQISPELPIVWDLSDLSDFYVYEFGFYTDEAKQVEVGTDGISLSLDESGTGTNTYTATGSVYVGWTIESPENITATLQIKKAMSNITTQSQTVIPLKASWEAGDEEDKAIVITPGSTGTTETDGSYTVAKLFDFSPKGTENSSDGVLKIDFVTGDATLAEPGNYQTELSFVVSTNS